MSTLSYGLNITKKTPSLVVRPPPAKRKTIFDDDSGPEDGPDHEDNAESIDTIGGLTTTASKPSKIESANLIKKASKSTKISQYGDLSTHHSSSRHSKSAQTIDPSIYDYDSIYDSLHAKPSSSSSAPADVEKRPKYMSSLISAAEVRKRDQLRAKDKMLAKEREAEGDEFAHKEKFVTSAYKRQQEEMRRLEAEEAIREKEVEERKKREGGGLKGLYKNMLEKDERNHAAVMKAVETAKAQGPEIGPNKKDEKVEKSEADLAREKGAIINEDGQVVDKRQLLNAGLNASATPKPTAPDPKSRSTLNPPTGARTGTRGHPTHESARERETRLFEEQLLGKRAFAEDDEEGEAARAAKSRKLEDEILAGLGG